MRYVMKQGHRDHFTASINRTKTNQNTISQNSYLNRIRCFPRPSRLDAATSRSQGTPGPWALKGVLLGTPWINPTFPSGGAGGDWGRSGGMGQGMPDPGGGDWGRLGQCGPGGPNYGPNFGPGWWAQLRAPIRAPNFGGPNSPSLPFAKYPIPRAREPHTDLRSTMLYRNS